MKKTLAIAILGALAIVSAACSSSGVNNSSNSNANKTTVVAPATNHPHEPSTGQPNDNTARKDDVPAAVHAAFPDAQSITTQHKDLTPAQISSIEKETNTKVPDKDHHSYLAFSTSGGTRKQLGAATLVEAGGRQIVIVYESREGVPYIKEVRAEGLAQAFLDQFKGKGHDDKFQIGQDLKALGVDQPTAQGTAEAVRRDAMTMQTLYGGAHSH